MNPGMTSVKNAMAAINKKRIAKIVAGGAANSYELTKSSGSR
jgi:hypothetical protein